jgi:hypothetical protein
MKLAVDFDQHLTRARHWVRKLAELERVDAVEAAANDGAHLSPALARGP